MCNGTSIAYLLVPFTDIEIIDDWRVLGLAGTGSHSLRIRDVFVPDHCCALLSQLFAGPARRCTRNIRWRARRAG